MSDSRHVTAVSPFWQSVPKLAEDEVDWLVQKLVEMNELALQHSSEWKSNLDQALLPVLRQLATRESSRLEQSSAGSGWTSQRLQDTEQLYRSSPPESDLRNHLLHWMASSEDERVLESWTELVCEDPPEHRLGIILAFAPLMQSRFAPPGSMLSDLLNRATSHSQIAPAVFDLFNFYFRHGRIEQHPVIERADPLIRLLQSLTSQLGQIERGEIPSHCDARQLNQLVSDSVALIVALCDAFALAEYTDVIPVLHQTLQLRHRRVQTEAAAALARLDDPAGKQALIELAQQPVSRLRVLAYAEELGFQHEISLELQGEIALAESHLAIWLSEPDQMGLAPSSIELIDNRELYWPSYEHPVQCYLFQYAYGQGEKAHSNIGICGPLTHAFAADLRHLPVEEIYAAFAGWQTIHQEIFQMPLHRARQTFANDLRRLEDALGDCEVDEAVIQSVGSFFGELVLVATGSYEGRPGTLIVDPHDSSWFEQGNPEAPIDWNLAYSIWRGKRLLSKFNPSQSR